MNYTVVLSWSVHCFYFYFDWRQMELYAFLRPQSVQLLMRKASNLL